MDDERLRARLRSIDIEARPRAEFVEELHDELAQRLDFGHAPTGRLAGAPARVANRRAIPARRWVLLAAAVLLMAALLANVAAIGSVVSRLVAPSVLDDLRATGTIHVAVRPDRPQVAAPGGTLQGFDIAVVTDLAERLGVSAQLTVQPVEDMLAPEQPQWQLALPSRSLSATESARWLPTQPYYSWPLSVLVPSDPAGDVLTIDDLDGKTVCVVAGSAAEAWLEGEQQPRLTVLVQPPQRVTTRSLESDDACQADVLGGRSDAFVTSTKTGTDIATEDRFRALGPGLVALEPRTMLVPNGAASGRSLVDAVDRALEQMRADGSLPALAERWFGGEDLSSIGPPLP